MFAVIRKILSFARNIKGSLKVIENKRKVTLVGGYQFFDNVSGVTLTCGSTKEDIVMNEHSELFGELISFNHGKITNGQERQKVSGSS